MASLPHTPPSNTPTTSCAHRSPAVETIREAGARFDNRESTPPPSAVHHSFHPVRDIVSGSGSHNHPQRGPAPSNGRTLEEVEQSPPGAFPSAEEEREADAGDEVQHAVTAIRGYAKSHLPASLGIYIDTKEEDQSQKSQVGVGSSLATSEESSVLSPEERKYSAEVQSRSTNNGASHNTNPFRDPEFMRTHDPRAPQQPDIHQGDSLSNVSRMRMTSTEVYPTTTRPSGYTDEPSAWTSFYADTSDPPTRTYDVVHDPLTGPPQDVSSGFGRSIRRASLIEPITTARAVPFIAEPPLVVYPNTSTPISASTARPFEHGPPIISALYEDRQGGASVQGASSLETPTISDQEQSASRDVSAEGKEAKELPPESQTEAKPKSKGFFSRLNKLFRSKSASKNGGKSSKEESSTKHPDSPRGERDAGQSSTHKVLSGRTSVQTNLVDSSARPHPIAEGSEPSKATTVSETHKRNVTPPTDIPSSISGKAVGARPVRIAETPSLGARPKSTGFRRHTHPDIIPKNVPAHFDETIGPLPGHVKMRGKRELPTKEKPGGSRVGVGSLPGRRDEAGVARLPDERNGLIAAWQGRAYDERHPQVMDREGETDTGVGAPLISQTSQQCSSSPQGSSLSVSSSSEGAEQVDEPRNGYLSELFCDAEEILRDLGHVALYYVPGFGYLSGSDSSVDHSAESQPIQTTEVAGEQSSPSPSPVAGTMPPRAPPSSPVIGFQTGSRLTSTEDTKAESELSGSAATTLTPLPSVTVSCLFATQLSALAQPDQFETPMDPSSHPSRSSSAEEVDCVNHEVVIVGPPSTRERISGKQEYVASPLKREYIKPPTLEDHAAVEAAGSLPGYPTEAGLRALIGERVYDDEMRAAGAAEPVEMATSLTGPLERPQVETTATEAPIEIQPLSKFPSGSQAVPLHSDPPYSVLSPPPISVSTSRDNVESTTKGLDIKSLGVPVAEGKQEKKQLSHIVSEKRQKSHN